LDQDEKWGTGLIVQSIIFGSRKATTWIVVILLLATCSFGPAVPAKDDDQGQATVDIMTQNLFMGTDFPEILAAQTFPEFLQAVTTTYENVLETRPAERMAAVAREIARLKPNLVGLQEATIVRIGATTFPASPATNVQLDLLEILLGELDDLGQRYAAVAILSGLDAQAPSTLGFDVRFTVQDVILVRTDRPKKDFSLSNVQVHPYQTQLTFPSVIGPLTNPSGWASVDVQGRGWKFRFVTTHLALAPGFDPTVALSQAQELREIAGNTDLPVVFVGDFNSTAMDPTNPTFETYRSFIDAGFVDAWPKTHPVDPGFTCCQSSDVSNAQSALSHRIDLIFVRGSMDIINSRLVGDRQADRTPSGFWPSDHAGVTAKLRFRQTHARQ
jgi:endonuclease/exonuclease/phosphatase family metal-dependent hydrolase